MPKYFFTARSRQGQPYSGTQEAKNEHELARALREEGYVLISASPEEEKGKLEFSIPFFSRVSFKDKMMLAKNLQVMIGAGVSLPNALKTLAEQTKSRKLKKILLEIAQDVIKGKSFSESLSRYPNVFSELFCSMVKIGEESGTLEENLAVLSRQMRREYELGSKIKGALMYPAVIILAMVGIGIMMLIVVVPKLSETFRELEIELPLTTKLVIGFGNFLADKWYLVALFFIIMFFLGRLALKTKQGKKIVSILAIRTPIVSQLIKKTNSAYTVRTLSSLLSAGVPLVRSLEIIADTLGNFYFKKAIRDSLEQVRKGSKLSEALKPYANLYSVSVIQMIRVGEETGETSDVLAKLGDFFEEEVTNTTKNLASIIEPILMLLIGGVVGFFAISMIQPMYSMLGGIE